MKNRAEQKPRPPARRQTRDRSKTAPDLWEVRSSLEGRIVRTLFTVLADEMVLLHAFIKKSQKTPKVDLDTAIRCLGQIKGGSHG